MKHVILNLCKNAVEAMTDGGCLTIKTFGAEGNVVLEITDDGFGVPDDVDVFELFKTTKPGGYRPGTAGSAAGYFSSQRHDRLQE